MKGKRSFSLPSVYPELQKELFLPIGNLMSYPGEIQENGL